MTDGVSVRVYTRVFHRLGRAVRYYSAHKLNEYRLGEEKDTFR